MIDAGLMRLLWRYEYGRFAPELFEIELRAMLETVSDEGADLHTQKPTVRLWAPDLLRSREEAFAAASRAIAALRYREAVRHIVRCRRVIAEMHELLRALEDCDRAESAATAVHDLAGVIRLRRLPSVASLAQVVDLARQHIVGQDFKQASGIAGVCTRLAEALLEQRGNRASAEDASVRIEQLEHLCIATQPFLTPPRDDPASDGTFPVLRHLLRGGYSRLGRRLLAELEIQLGGRRRFLLLYERNGADTATVFGSKDAIRNVIRDGSWDEAVDLCWLRSIARHGDTLTRQSDEIGAVVAAVDDAIRSLTTDA